MSAKKTIKTNIVKSVPIGSDWGIRITEIPQDTGDLIQIAMVAQNGKTTNTFSGATFPAHVLDGLIKALAEISDEREMRQ